MSGGEVPAPERSLYLMEMGRGEGGLNHLDSFLPSKFQFARQEGEAEAKNAACVFQGMLWLPALVS